jgi:WD40 repeat protein
MKKLIITLLALSGVSYLACSQVETKLAKYDEVKESESYKMLAGILYEYGKFPAVLVDEVAGMLTVCGGVDTSDHIFKGGYAEINYGKESSFAFGGRLSQPFDTIQKLTPESLACGVTSAEISGGRLTIMNNQNRIVHELSYGVHCLQVLLRGAVAAGCKSGHIALFNPVSGACLASIATGSEVHALCELDNQHLVSGNQNGKICLWDLEQRKCIQTFSSPLNKINYLVRGPGGYLIAFGRKERGGNYFATIWALKKNRLDITEGTSDIPLSSSSSSSSMSSVQSSSAPQRENRRMRVWNNVRGLVAGSFKMPDVDLSLVGGL